MLTYYVVWFVRKKYDDEDGARVPRLLPCSHTVCESCIKETMGNQTFVCPVCRKKHRAQNKEKSFPQNMYLLVHIQRRAYERCDVHNMELTLYCYQDSCCKSICLSCLVDHNKHDVKTIETKERELLKNESQNVKKFLEANVQIVSEAQKYVAQKTDVCVTQLENTKDKIVKYFDKMIKKAYHQKNRTDLHVHKMKKAIELLSQMEEKMEGRDCETTTNIRETVCLSRAKRISLV